MTEDRSPRFDYLVALLATTIGVLGSTLAFFSSNRTVAALSLAAGAFVVMTLAYYLISSTRQLPTSLSVALVGPPGVGKTVFLTILFRELETGRLGPLLFAPAGPETTQEVARNVSLMASGEFPPPTPIGKPLVYQAVARLGRLLPREYRISISDFAGEYLFRKPSDENWLLDADFFKYLVSSDAILFMIDCRTLLDDEAERAAHLENTLIAALNLVIEQRNANPMQPLKTPVALVFSKADLVWNAGADGEKKVVARLANFIAICTRRCRRFSYFFVSALGESPSDGNQPPRRIAPRGIVEPIAWILRA